MHFQTQSRVDFSDAVVTSLPEGCFALTVIGQLLLPAGITEVGLQCFYGARIAEISLSARNLRVLGDRCFKRFQTQSRVDLREAIITSLPDGCFAEAYIAQLLLPVGIIEVKAECFYEATIAEFSLPAQDLRLSSMGRRSFMRFQTTSREDLSEVILASICRPLLASATRATAVVSGQVALSMTG